MAPTNRSAKSNFSGSIILGCALIIIAIYYFLLFLTRGSQNKAHWHSIKECIWQLKFSPVNVEVNLPNDRLSPILRTTVPKEHARRGQTTNPCITASISVSPNGRSVINATCLENVRVHYDDPFRPICSTRAQKAPTCCSEPAALLQGDGPVCAWRWTLEGNLWAIRWLSGCLERVELPVHFEAQRQISTIIVVPVFPESGSNQETEDDVDYMSDGDYYPLSPGLQQVFLTLEPVLPSTENTDKELEALPDNAQDYFPSEWLADRRDEKENSVVQLATVAAYRREKFYGLPLPPRLYSPSPDFNRMARYEVPLSDQSLTPSEWLDLYGGSQVSSTQQFTESSTPLSRVPDDDTLSMVSSYLSMDGNDAHEFNNHLNLSRDLALLGGWVEQDTVLSGIESSTIGTDDIDLSVIRENIDSPWVSVTGTSDPFLHFNETLDLYDRLHVSSTQQFSESSIPHSGVPDNDTLSVVSSYMISSYLSVDEHDAHEFNNHSNMNQDLALVGDWIEQDTLFSGIDSSTIGVVRIDPTVIPETVVLSLSPTISTSDPFYHVSEGLYGETLGEAVITDTLTSSSLKRRRASESGEIPGPSLLAKRRQQSRSDSQTLLGAVTPNLLLPNASRSGSGSTVPTSNQGSVQSVDWGTSTLCSPVTQTLGERTGPPTAKVCSVCSSCFATTGLLNDHIRRKHARRFECTLCSRRFNLKTDLERHQRCIHHISTHGSRHRSWICSNRPCFTPGKAFVRKDNFDRHVKRCMNPSSKHRK